MKFWRKSLLVEVGGGVEPFLRDDRPTLRVVVEQPRLFVDLDYMMSSFKMAMMIMLMIMLMVMLMIILMVVLMMMRETSIHGMPSSLSPS